MIYIAGDNDLTEMRGVRSTGDVNIMTEFDNKEDRERIREGETQRNR